MRAVPSILAVACASCGGTTEDASDARRIDADESRPRYLYPHVNLAIQDDAIGRQPLGVDAQGNALVLMVEDGDLKSFRLSGEAGLWGDAALVEAGTAAVANPAVAVTPAGEGFAFFAQDGRLFWNYFNAGVWVWDVEEELSSTCTFIGGAPEPVAGVDVSGNVLVAWTCPQENAVYAKTWSGVERIWGPDVALSPAGSDPRRLGLRVAPSGRAAAGWRAGDGSLHIALYDGSIWAPAQPMPGTSFASDGVLSMAVRDDGETLAVWEEPDGLIAFLRSARWDPETSAWEPMRTLAETTTNLGMQQYIASASVSSVGQRAVLLWSLWGAGLPSDTFLTSWTVGDADWAMPIEIETLGNWPAASMTPEGDALVVWSGSYGAVAELWPKDNASLIPVEQRTEFEIYAPSVVFAPGGDGVIAGRCILRDGAGFVAEERLCATLYRR